MEENTTNRSSGTSTEAANKDEDEILAHFQEITHLDNDEQCKQILEFANWNLDAAVQSYFTGDYLNFTEQMVESDHVDFSNHVAPNLPQPNAISMHDFNINQLNLLSGQDGTGGIIGTSFGTQVLANQRDDDIQPLPFEPASMSSFGPFLNGPANNMYKRLLVFNVDYQNEKVTLHVPDNEKIKKLKELIEEKLHVKVKHQKLIGWKNKNTYKTDEHLLSELNLPLDNNLSVINMALVNNSSENASILHVKEPSALSSADADGSEIELIIKLINTSKQMTIINYSKTFDSTDLLQDNQSSNQHRNTLFRLNFETSSRFIEIRRKLALLTNVLVNDQEWWYFNSSNSSSLDSDMELVKAANDLSAFHKLIDAEKLFSLPLTSIIEDQMTLNEMRRSIEELTKGHSNNVCIKKSSNDLDENNDDDVIIINSKLTPQPSSSVQQAKSSNKMIFVITLRQGAQLASASSYSNNKAVNPFSQLTENEDQSTSKKAKTDEDNDIQIDEEMHDITNDDVEVLDDEDDLDEHYLLNNSASSSNHRKQKPLIGKDCMVGDEYSCTNSIVEQFTERYGPMVPLFFIGTLEDAIREALLCPAKDRKLLGIYLHSDHTVFCNIFCSKTLCDENVVNFLSSNFVVWPWDLTNKEHENYFYETCSKYLGSVFVSNLRSNKEKFPAFLIVHRVRSNNEVAAIIEGDSTSESMMDRLMQAYEMFESQRLRDEQDEYTRDERERIKREQDAAYQASLEQDKAKRQRQTEENEQRELEKLKEIEMEQTRAQQLERRKMDSKSKLIEEPDEKQPLSKVTRIRFRLPDGETLTRKFYISESLSSIVHYAASHGFFVEEYKILSSWPRRDLTTESLDKTIEQLKLFPQETLTIEQR